MGRWLVRQGLAPEWIVTSTARRARETAELLADAIDFRGLIETREDLYHASPEHLAATLLPLAAAERSLLVVGHNPGLEELLADWTDEPRRFPTAAVAALRVSPPTDEEGYSVALQEFWKPKKLPTEFDAEPDRGGE